MARAETQDLREVPVGVEPLRHHPGDDDPGQPRARQRPLVAQHLHLQS